MNNEEIEEDKKTEQVKAQMYKKASLKLSLSLRLYVLEVCTVPTYLSVDVCKFESEDLNRLTYRDKGECPGRKNGKTQSDRAESLG